MLLFGLVIGVALCVPRLQPELLMGEAQNLEEEEEVAVFHPGRDAHKYTVGNCKPECSFADLKESKDKYVGSVLMAIPTGVPEDHANIQQNLRRFTYYRRYVIPKYTKLLHVSKSNDWTTKSFIGSANMDGYSYFTLDGHGFAGAHGNNFHARLTLEAMEDFEVVFVASYTETSLWDIGLEQFAKGSMEKVTETHPNLGGDWIGYMQTALPYRISAFMSCSECEIVVHNRAIPTFLRLTGLAHWTDGAWKVVPLDQWPAHPDYGMRPGVKGLRVAWTNRDKDVSTAAQAVKRPFSEDSLRSFRE